MIYFACSFEILLDEKMMTIGFGVKTPPGQKKYSCLCLHDMYTHQLSVHKTFRSAFTPFIPDTPCGNDPEILYGLKTEQTEIFSNYTRHIYTGTSIYTCTRILPSPADNKLLR
jgi:hypothetical protein